MVFIQDDVRTHTRVVVLMAVAQENGTMMQQAYEGPGRYMGFEIFDAIDTRKLALEVAESAITVTYQQKI
jgi:TldD protein